MKSINSIFRRIKGFYNWLLSRSIKIKLTLLVVSVFVLWFIIPKIITSKTSQVQYQTAIVAKGMLIVSVSASAQVSSANTSPITTKASGIVKKLYVKDGDKVIQGDKIAELTLDFPGQQIATSALSSYQSAVNSLESAKTTAYTLQSELFTQWEKHLDLSTNSTYQNGDGSPNTANRTLPEFHISENTWLAAEAKYKNQQAVINQAQTSLSAAWYSYQQSSPILYAPISGTISGLSLQEGSVVGTTQATSTSNTQSSTTIATVHATTSPMVVVSLSQIDAPNVKVGNKVSLTFDAFSTKSFTGVVTSVDTVGSISSGVTSYPVYIVLDTNDIPILPNMSAQANIIVATKSDVLLIPVSAIQTQNRQSTVRVLKNGETVLIPVEIGLSSTTDAEVISGLQEGDEVITGSSSTSSSQSTQTSSPFSTFGGGRTGGFGSGAVRIPAR